MGQSISDILDKLYNLSIILISELYHTGSYGTAVKDTGFFTPPQNRGGVIFLLQFVCVCVYVCVSVCEQNAHQTATPILTWSSLNRYGLYLAYY